MDNEQFQEFVVSHLMNLTDRMTSMEGRLLSLEGTVLRIEMRMENEIIDKIKILFDGHQQHEVRLERVEKRIGITGT